MRDMYTIPCVDTRLAMDNTLPRSRFRSNKCPARGTVQTPRCASVVYAKIWARPLQGLHVFLVCGTLVSDKPSLGKPVPRRVCVLRMVLRCLRYFVLARAQTFYGSTQIVALALTFLRDPPLVCPPPSLPSSSYDHLHDDLV